MRRKNTVLALSFILILTISYITFNTDINLKVKDNIYSKGELCFETKDMVKSQSNFHRHHNIYRKFFFL